MEILEAVSIYIYNFPRIVFAQPEEECTEFYLYIYDRLPKILLKYKVQKTKFLTWFALVLRRQYINWQEKQAREKNKSIVTKYCNLEAIISPEYLNYFSLEKSQETSEKSFLNETILSVFASLPAKVRVTMKLHYFEFFEGKDLKEVTEVFQRDPIELLEKYGKLLEMSQAQYEKERKLRISLNQYFHKYQIINQKLIDFSQEPSLDNVSEKLNHLISKTKEQRDSCYQSIKKYQLELGKSYVQIKPKDIAKFLNASPNAVHHLLYRGKTLIQEKLKETLKDYFPKESFNQPKKYKKGMI